MKVTTKFQVTNPNEVRMQLGIHPGSDVEFSIEGNSVKLVRVSGLVQLRKELVAALRGKGTIKMSTDEILNLTRGRPVDSLVTTPPGTLPLHD